MSEKITAKIVESTGEIHILRGSEVIYRIDMNNKQDFSNHIIEVQANSRIEIRPLTSHQIQLKF